ncbi:MAG: hypothetical protein ACR2HN_03800 [Tepidiformaceae bacterium]
MTAKQAPRDRIRRFSEEEAAEWLARIEWESTETETLSEDEMTALLAADREISAGNFVDGEEALRRLGL